MANLVYISIIPVSDLPDVVDVEEAKRPCHCDVDTWDADFVRWIQAARQSLEMYTGVVFLPSNVKATYALHGKECSFQPLFINGATLTGKYLIEDGLINTYDRRVSLSYTAGGNPEPWMKEAVLLYVADLYKNRGDEKLGDVGKDAFSYCSPFRVGGVI